MITVRHTQQDDQTQQAGFITMIVLMVLILGAIITFAYMHVKRLQ